MSYRPRDCLLYKMNIHELIILRPDFCILGPNIWYYGVVAILKQMVGQIQRSDVKKKNLLSHFRPATDETQNVARNYSHEAGSYCAIPVAHTVKAIKISIQGDKENSRTFVVLIFFMCSAKYLCFPKKLHFTMKSKFFPLIF